MPYPVLEIVVGTAAPLLIWLYLRLRRERAATRHAHEEVSRLRAVLGVLNTGFAATPLAASEVRGELVADLRNKLMAASLNARVVADALDTPVAERDDDLDEAVDDLESALRAMRGTLERLPTLLDDPHTELPAASVPAALAHVARLHREGPSTSRLTVAPAQAPAVVRVAGGLEALVVVLDSLARHVLARVPGEASPARLAVAALDATACEFAVEATGEPPARADARATEQPALDLSVIERWAHASGGSLHSEPTTQGLPRLVLRLLRADGGN